ncbi:MAG: hypothetical protein AAF434_04080 [Pseudomonadota bacterium]
MVELKSDTEELWLLRHSIPLRWLGWIGTPFLFVCGFYVLFLPVWENNFELVLIASSILLGGFPIYMSLQCFKAFPYIKADVEFSHNGFSVYWPSGKNKEYTWGEIGKLNHYASAQVLEVKNRQGKRILAVSEQATSYAQFVEISVENTGLKY